jgi:hypothetical protein
MDRLREKVNPEEMGVLRGPTRYITQQNRHALHCRECGDLYYVDDSTIRRLHAVLKGDSSENPFCCPRCEEEYTEDAYGH